MQVQKLSVKPAIATPVMVALLLVTLVVASHSQSASARSILPEQSEAASARDAVGDSMSKLQDLNKRIESQEALIAKEQERLKQYQTEKAQTEQDLEARKAVFEQKSKALDEAWKSRNNY
jgi:peptidoglycan hydrolase CwlO-like protein